MFRSGFGLTLDEDESLKDGGKCFSLVRNFGGNNYIIIGDLLIHANLIYHMDKEHLKTFILGKLNNKRCFKFNYKPQNQDVLKLCFSIERGFNFYFVYDWVKWKPVNKISFQDSFPFFVKEFIEMEESEKQAS